MGGLFHCYMLDESICHVRVSGLFVTFILSSMENPVSKHCRPLSDAACGSALFAYDPFTSFQVRIG